MPGRAAALFFQTGAVSDRPIPSLGGYPLICAQRVVACVFCHSRNWRNKASRSSDRAGPEKARLILAQELFEFIADVACRHRVAVPVKPFLCRAGNEPIRARVR